MSWIIWTKADIADAQLEQKFRLDVAMEMARTPESFGAVETNEQVQAAIDIALFALRHHKAVGATALAVELSGHANPSHRKQKNVANDFITVTVSAA